MVEPDSHGEERTLMKTLTEIYQQGQERIAGEKYGLLLRGVETEFTLRRNERIYQRYLFVQKAIGSVAASTQTSLGDIPLSAPIIMSSMTNPMHAIVENGLLKLAQGLKAAGSMVWLGSPLPGDLQEVIEVGCPVGQTVKPYQERSRIVQELQAAQDAGVAWIGIEVDAGEGTKIMDQQRTHSFRPLSVKEIKEIKSGLRVPMLLKGILSRQDAESAMEAGADAIVVSNHGAHTIDYLPHPLDVLPEIAAVVKGAAPIIADGGFRRGTDVLKALALGANLVGLGRPILYGLAADGADGVEAVVRLMAEELRRVMTMTGVARPEDARPEILLRD